MHIPVQLLSCLHLPKVVVLQAQKGPERHRLQSVKLVPVTFYRAVHTCAIKQLSDLQIRIIISNPQASILLTQAWDVP